MQQKWRDYTSSVMLMVTFHMEAVILVTQFKFILYPNKKLISFLDPAYRVCALAGAQPGQTVMSGEQYIELVYNIKVSQKALDIIVPILFWLLFTVINYYLVETKDRVSGNGSCLFYAICELILLKADL